MLEFEGSNLNQNVLLAGYYVLNDVGIRNEIEKGNITLDSELDDKQYQPNTLDMKIGDVKIWENGNLVKEFSKKDIGAEVVCEPYKVVQVHFANQLKTNNIVMGDLRSGRGKAGLYLENNFIRQDEKGYNVFLFNTNKAPIKIYVGDRFCQLFFFSDIEIEGSGKIESTFKNVKKIAKTISPELKTLGPYVVFNIGDSVLKQKLYKTLDTRNENYIQDNFDKFTIKKNFVFNSEQNYVVKLNPKLEVPSNIGIQITGTIPFKQEELNNSMNFTKYLIRQRAKAGWIDSGFKGNVTAHPYFHNVSVKYVKNQPFVVGLIYKYNVNSKRVYGSKSLGSHHQNSDGATSS